MQPDLSLLTVKNVPKFALQKNISLRLNSIDGIVLYGVCECVSVFVCVCLCVSDQVCMSLAV